MLVGDLFLQTDPIGYKSDMDLYAAMGNDPINKTDPTGLYTCGASLSSTQCGQAMDAQKAARSSITATMGTLKDISSKLKSGGTLTSAEQKVADKVSNVMGHNAGSNTKTLDALVSTGTKMVGMMDSKTPMEIGHEAGAFANARSPDKMVLNDSFFTQGAASQAQIVAHEAAHHAVAAIDVFMIPLGRKGYVEVAGEEALSKYSKWHDLDTTSSIADGISISLGLGRE